MLCLVVLCTIEFENGLPVVHAGFVFSFWFVPENTPLESPRVRLLMNEAWVRHMSLNLKYVNLKRPLNLRFGPS